MSDAVAGVAIGVVTRPDDVKDSIDYRLLTDLMVSLLSNCTAFYMHVMLK